MKVLFLGAFSSYSGYGNDCIGMAKAMLKLGIDLYILPSVVQAPLPKYIADLFTKRLEAPFDVVIQHADPTQLNLSKIARRSAAITVGSTMWEFSDLSGCPGRSSLSKRLEMFDIVFGYDDNTINGLSPYAKKTKLAICQGGYAAELWPYVERDWFGPRFGFCQVGALGPRKVPFLTINAFRELKEEYPEEFDGAELHMKDANGLNLHPAMEQWVPKLRIHNGIWPEDLLYDFYSKQHMLLAPSLGEGKNMPALEFLGTGGSVAVTNWGGHTQWLREDFGYGIDYELKQENPKQTAMSARASKDHLKKIMLHVYRNRGEVKRKGEIGASIIPQSMNWESVMDRFFRQVVDLHPKGRALADKLAMCQPRIIK